MSKRLHECEFVFDIKILPNSIGTVHTAPRAKEKYKNKCLKKCACACACMNVSACACACACACMNVSACLILRLCLIALVLCTQRQGLKKSI